MKTRFRSTKFMRTYPHVMKEMQVSIEDERSYREDNKGELSRKDVMQSKVREKEFQKFLREIYANKLKR